MKSHVLVVVGCAMWVMGCAEKAAEPPAPAEETTTPPVTEAETVDRDAFRRHMHWHAEKLDDLNFALADEDLEGAGSAAYWLSRHDQVEGMPPELRPYLTGMRSAALAVEAATDLDSARAAAEDINEECQGCHEAAGVTAE